MKALFRCDATADIGFGHLSRCIALAEALDVFGAESAFAGAYDDAAAEQIALAGFECLPMQTPVNSGADDALPVADFIVLDSYRADADYLAALKALGPGLVVIDDFCQLPVYPCDAILNFTWEAPQLGYPEGPAHLLGPNYLLARRKLVEARSQSVERDRSGPVNNLLVAVGGSDPKAITARLVQALGRRPDICLRTISANPEELIPQLSAFATDSIALPRQPDLAAHLLWADAAITGGGLIKYESAYMAVPAAAIAQNEGQDGETQVFAAAGLVFDLGLADSVGDEELAARLDTFISGTDLRSDMAGRMRESFIPDPAANAARGVLEAVRH